MDLPPTDDAGRFLPNLRTGSIIKRCVAKFLDLLVAGVVTGGLALVIPFPLASLVGMSWLCLTDWLGSPGKWLFQLRAVTLEGAPLGPLAALKRNGVLGLPSVAQAFLASGWIGLQGQNQKWDGALIACVGLAVWLGEIIGMVMQPENRRWGDAFARSRVVDR